MTHSLWILRRDLFSSIVQVDTKIRNEKYPSGKRSGSLDHQLEDSDHNVARKVFQEGPMRLIDLSSLPHKADIEKMNSVSRSSQSGVL